MLLYIADKIIANKPYLTEIDSAIGDGDHGIGMAGGMQKAKRKLLKLEDQENVYRIFEEAGQAMLMSMGGASGVIFGSLYLAGAKGMESKNVLTAFDLAEMEEKSLAAIQERGGAKVGDKTMVDALAPAVEALKKNAESWTAGDAETSRRSGEDRYGRYQEICSKIRTCEISFGKGNWTSGCRCNLCISDFPGNERIRGRHIEILEKIKERI